MDALAIGILVGLSAIAAGFGNAMIVSRTLESMSRQPEMSGALRTVMFIGVGIVEVIPLLGVVIAFLMFFTGS